MDCIAGTQKIIVNGNRTVAIWWVGRRARNSLWPVPNKIQILSGERRRELDANRCERCSWFMDEVKDSGSLLV